MFFLYFEIAMLALAIIVVGACSIQLFVEDQGIQLWINQKHDQLGTYILERSKAANAWAKQLMVRYKHQPRHTPQHIARRTEWVKNSYALSAT